MTTPELLAAHEEYSHGASLAEVGRQLGVSRERVRQLFKEAGLATRSPAQAQAIRKEAIQREAEGRRQEVVALYKELGNLDAVHARIDLPRAVIADIVDDLADRQAYRHHAMGAKYSRERLISDLHKAHRHLGGDLLSQIGYTTVAARLGLVSLTTQMKFFGSWPKALQAAGLRGYPALGRRASSLTREQCLEAVTQCVREHGGQWVPANTYSVWAAANDKPSCPSVRNLVGRWKEVMVLVLDKLAADAV